jgi:nucleotide-binding universal stress UspA family protein
MIGTLLAAVDASEHGARGVDHALFVARVFGSRIQALSVLETKKIEGPLLRDYLATVGLAPGLDYCQKVERFLDMKAKEILSDFGNRCAAGRIPFEAEVLRGIPSRAILERSASTDLIIIGQRGENADWQGETLGGCVQAVVRASQRPILVTPRRYRPIDRALVAYDGSEHARDALDLAADIARRTQLFFTVLTAGGGEALDEGRRREVAERIGPNPPAYDLAVARGEPWHAILESAANLDCQLIVMGAYGHSRIRELIIGSTTEQVLRKTKLPVLLSR